jgi:hypothetical protein
VRRPSPGTGPNRSGSSAAISTCRPIPSPREPGDLLRYDPAVDVSIEGGTAWRVMYLSESLQGDPIVVTGLVVVPTAPAPPEGRPLVTVAPWSMGIADERAGSHDPNAVGLVLTAPFVDAGYVVTLTDYEGLGTPGRHPYLVGESEGRSVLGAARAATHVPDAAVGDRDAIMGYGKLCEVPWSSERLRPAAASFRRLSRAGGVDRGRRRRRRRRRRRGPPRSRPRRERPSPRRR